MVLIISTLSMVFSSTPHLVFYSAEQIKKNNITSIELRYRNEALCSPGDTAFAKFVFDNGIIQYTSSRKCSGGEFGFTYHYKDNQLIDKIGTSDYWSADWHEMYSFHYVSNKLKEIIYLSISGTDSTGSSEHNISYSYFNNGLLKSSSDGGHCVYDQNKRLLGFVGLTSGEENLLKNSDYEGHMSYYRKHKNIAEIISSTFDLYLPANGFDYRYPHAMLINGIELQRYFETKNERKADYVIFEIAANEFLFYKVTTSK